MFGFAITWVDALALLFVLLSVIRGTQEGLVKQLVGIAGLILGLLVGYAYYPVFSAYLDRTFHLTDQISGLVGESLGQFGISAWITMAISFVMLFFLVRFAVFLVGQLADRVLSVPILYQFNHLGGGVVGFIKAAVSVWLVMSVLALLPAEPVQNWLKSPGMLQTMVTYMPQVYNRLGNLLPTWELLGR